MKLLIAEDEKDLNRILASKLRKEHYTVETCYDGETALESLSAGKYDGVILDIMLPGRSGFEVLSEMRKRGDQTPVLFLTALNDTNSIVQGLDLGASDYMVKPFVLSELMARVRVMMRNTAVVNENVCRCGDIVVNTNDRSVLRAGRKVELTAKEYTMLLYLMRNKNTVVTRQQIVTNVWDADSDIASNIVDVYIRFIRKKLNEGGHEDLIHAVRGVGYMLKDGREEA
ncbi:MAG TPA: DNA-binding response regulator [Lachnospiraceae bacterium]|nr:DNA-binding response regulator [Lachnospiraceae bacterium]